MMHRTNIVNIWGNRVNNELPFGILFVIILLNFEQIFHVLKNFGFWQYNFFSQNYIRNRVYNIRRRIQFHTFLCKKSKKNRAAEKILCTRNFVDYDVNFTLLLENNNYFITSFCSWSNGESFAPKISACLSVENTKKSKHVIPKPMFSKIAFFTYSVLYNVVASFVMSLKDKGSVLGAIIDLFIYNLNCKVTEKSERSDSRV
jgi:hypothetical protein